LLTPAFHGMTSARPNPSAARPTIRAQHAGGRPHWWARKWRRRRRRCGIPAAGMELSHRGEGLGAAAEEEGWGRGAVSGRCASVRADVGVAELAGDGRRRCARVGEEWRVGEERSIKEGRRVGEEPLVGDGRGKERRRRWPRRKRGKAAIWGETSKCRSGKRGGLIQNPRPFVTGCIHNRDKRPFSLGSLRPKTKGPLLSRVASRPVKKGAFRTGCLEGEFSPISLGWLLTDKRHIPLRYASVRTPHRFHHGIPKVLVNPRSKGITSVQSTSTH
jgi:hypothetical protein